jgi:hypothetical protein
MALALVFVIIALGCIMLMLDYDTIFKAWMGLLAAFVLFASGIAVGVYFERKNMLPQ